MQQQKKNILIISGTLPPEASATSIVVQKILHPLKELGCCVEGLTVKQNFCDEAEIDYKGMSIYKADCVLYPAVTIRCAKDFFYKVYQRLKNSKREKAVYTERVVRALVKKMKCLPMERYDWVIALCAYYEAAEALARYKREYGLNAKTALYQVDPLAGNQTFNRDDPLELQAYEETLYRTFDHVFTTPVILQEKKRLGWDTAAVTALELPISLEQHEVKVAKRDEIRCVYAGYLYGQLRDASFTLRLFAQMQDPRIQLYFVGNGQKKLLSAYNKGALKGRLHLLGEKPAKECDEILADADVLVNIGNTVNNQTPSKLLHYLGFGKPILNVISCVDCPSLSYVENYPLVLNVDGTRQEPADVTEIQEWITENRGKKVDYSEVAKLLTHCTPEYIAEQIYRNL